MSGRITARAVAATQAQLVANDYQLIEHLATAKLLTGKQLRILSSATTVYERRSLQRRLLRLTELRVMARLDRRVGGARAGSDSYVYALDVVGQRIVDDEPRRQWRKPWTPSIRILAHALAVSDLYVELMQAERNQDLELLHFAAEPACWRSFVGPGGAHLTLKPDAHVVLGIGETEQHAWIEMDRATESLTWITEKAKTYARYFATGKEQTRFGVFPRCLWIAPDQNRADGLTDALSRLPPDHWQLHHVTTTNGALEALTGQQQHLNEGPRP